VARGTHSPSLFTRDGAAEVREFLEWHGICTISAVMRLGRLRLVLAAALLSVQCSSAPERGDGGSACSGFADCLDCACNLGNCQSNDDPASPGCSPPCTDGATCFHVTVPPYSDGGPDQNFNLCLVQCENDSDCTGALCRRNQYGVKVCARPACASDADCTADPCGRCVPQVFIYHGGTTRLDFSSSSCIYSGECGPGSCGNCAAALQRSLPNNGTPSFHACLGDGG